MKHVYLTEAKIRRAVDLKQITKTEAIELSKSIEECYIDRKKRNPKKIRYEKLSDKIISVIL